jgi:hypothetical protein
MTSIDGSWVVPGSRRAVWVVDDVTEFTRRFVTTSRQIAEETHATKPAAAPVRTTPPPRTGDGVAYHEARGRTILVGAPMGKNAGDVTGICDTLYRNHYDVSSDSAETVHESYRIGNESGCDLDNKSLHIGYLSII